MIGVANAPQVQGLEIGHVESDFSSIDLESPGRNGATLHCFTSQRTACRVGRDINGGSTGTSERVFGRYSSCVRARSARIFNHITRISD